MFGHIFRLTFIIAGWYLVLPVIAHSATCNVTFGFDGEHAPVSALLVDIDYAGSTAAPLGEGAGVECDALVPGALTTFNDLDDQSLLKVGLVHLGGFGGNSVFACAFDGTAADVDTLAVVVADATSPSLEPVVPLPAVAINGVSCDSDPGEEEETTTGEEQPAPTTAGCEVTFRASTEVTVNGLMFEVAYGEAPAAPAGSAGGVECTTLLGGALGAFNDMEANQTLLAGLVHLDGFSGEADVVECYLDAAAAPSVADFGIVVTEAVDEDGAMISPLPLVEVAAIDCSDEHDGETSDDPTGSDGNGDGEPDGSGEEGSDESSSDEAGNEPGEGETSCDGPFDVTFAVDGDDELGALQFSVDYAGADGEFAGLSQDVSCEAGEVAIASLTSFNDMDENAQLNAGFVSLSGIEAPGQVLHCRFEADGRTPVAGDFQIFGIDASQPDLTPVAPAPAVTIVDISPAADNTACGPVCGDGIVDLATEECDDANDDEADSCLNDCTLNECGDGIVDESSEECDDANDDNGDACTNECTFNECGDGFVNEGVEDCDDANDDDTDSCLSTCTEARCGDGFVNEGFEDCDGGELNSDVQPDACRTSCTLPICGDGVADSDEECDDANGDDTDACLEGCVAARCGDGIVHEGIEACDAGQDNDDADPDSCRTDCSMADVCGDADGNGRLTATDAKIILDNAIGLTDSCDNSRCDVNASTGVSATDARVVLSAAIGLQAPLECWLPVVFSIDNESVVGGLQFSVDYSETGSTFVGSGDDVYCSNLDEGGVIASFNNDVEEQTLYVAMISSEGFEAPASVAACSFYQPGFVLVPEDFTVTVIDAIDPAMEPIADPQVSVDF